MHFGETDAVYCGNHTEHTDAVRLEGSQAVPASPSGKGEACIGDLFNFEFKHVGVGEMESNFGRAMLW
jgi:hypothetical protein